MNELSTAREIGAKPVQGCSRGSNGGSGKEDGVGVGVKGRAQIEEDEDAQSAGVSCHQEVVSGFQDGFFCAVMRAKARLELFIEVIFFER